MDGSHCCETRWTQLGNPGPFNCQLQEIKMSNIVASMQKCPSWLPSWSSPGPDTKSPLGTGVCVSVPNVELTSYLSKPN